MRLHGAELGFVVLQPQASGNPPATSWAPTDDADVYVVFGGAPTWLLCGTTPCYLMQPAWAILFQHPDHTHSRAH